MACYAQSLEVERKAESKLLVGAVQERFSEPRTAKFNPSRTVLFEIDIPSSREGSTAASQRRLECFKLEIVLR